MDNNATNQFTNDVAPLPERPQFLKVLCILTWICCGIIFISTLPGIFSQPTPEEQQLKIEKIREINPEAADKMEAVVSNYSGTELMLNSVLKLVAVVLSAYGAVLMWKLKKTGFYMYLAGEILPYFGFLFGGAKAMAAVGAMAGAMGSLAVGGVMAVVVLLDLAFIVMYAVNLKYMNK